MGNVMVMSDCLNTERAMGRTVRPARPWVRGTRVPAVVLLVLSFTFFIFNPSFAQGDEGHAATVTWRIHENQWRTEEEFKKLTKFFDEHPVTGKIAFFTCPSHVPPKFEHFLPCLPQLKKAIAHFKARGHRTGINHLCTIGQTDEDLDRAIVIEGAQYLVNWKGETAKSARCPLDPVWREKYVKPIYTVLAETGPDFIWTDDDIGRLSGHGVPGPGCFCPICMKRLHDRLGYSGDVKGLNAFFTDAEKGEARRRAMMTLNREVYADLLKYIREVVHAVDPKIVIGVMDSITAYTGNNYEEKFRALAPTGTEEVFFRPGGGYYNDIGGLGGVLSKANEMGYESAYLPDGVAVNESEIETFQYQLLHKANFSLKTESLAYMAAGTRGTAWNVFPFADNETYEAVAPRIESCEKVRVEADAIVAACGRAKPRGVWNGRGRDYFVGNKNGGRTGEWMQEEWWEKGFWQSELQMTGLPAAYREEECEVCAPNAQAVWSWTKEQLERRLAGGLYLPLDAAQAIIDRGYGEDLGFKIGKAVSKDARERFVDHPLNAGVAGFRRDMRQSFWGGDVIELEPMEGAQILADAVDIPGRVVAKCVSGVYENRRGGRIFMTGTMAWDRLSFSPVVRERKNVMRWLSRETLTGYIDSYHKAAMWVRGDRAIAIYNMSFDAAEGMEVLLKGEAWSKGIRLSGGDGTVIRGVREGAYTRYRLPKLAAWSVTAWARM
mgnify:CR=1 FL=1